MRNRNAVAITALVATIGVAGCGGSGPSTQVTAPDPNAAEVNPAGDIPDDQVFVPYSPPGGGYTVSVPEGWSQTSSGGAVTFTDKLNSITVEQAPASSAPTVSDVQSHEVPKLASSVPGFANPQVSVVQRKAGTGVLATYQATAKRDPVTGKAGTDAVERYTFFHNGQDVILTLSGPTGADNVDPWMIVSDSLKWTS